MQYMCYSAVQQPLARSGSNSGGSGSGSGSAVPRVNAAMRPITSIRLRTAAMARARDTCPVLSTATQSLGQPAMQLDHGGCTCLHTTVHIHTYTSLARPPWPRRRTQPVERDWHWCFHFIRACRFHV